MTRLKWILGTVAVLLVVTVVAAAVWLRPFPTADAARTVLASPPAGVRVSSDAAALTLAPTGRPRGGLVFQPGARVEAESYAAILAPIAEAGYVVEIVRQPLGIGFLAIDAPTALMARHPDVTDWTLGGHSLGGVAAAQYVADHREGPHKLLLWASYPAGSLADRSEVEVLTIAASNDGLSTPTKVDAQQHLLPAGSHVVEIEGAVHAFFGDYGVQSGDGEPTIDRADAQEQIRAASLTLLSSGR